MRLRVVLRRALLRRELERALEVALLLRRRGDSDGQRRTRRLAAAAERMKRRDYGKCAHCGEPISDARLKLMPGVGTCARCQKRIDAGA